MLIIVTLDLIFEVLHVLRVEFADYLGCDHLRTASKDKLSSLFYKTPLSWGDHQNTLYSGFAKGLRFLNMVITVILHPLSHYNFITEPRAWFLLSLLEGLTIDFPSHFILSFIDVYKDSAACDKLIFLSAITQILCHASFSYPESPHFSMMCVIDTATVRRSEAQLRSKRPRTEMATPPASSAPSTSAPYSSASGVTLEVVMAQLQRMDAHLDTLSDELCQVNTHVSRIARRQARLGGFMESPSLSLKASKDDDDDDDDASSSGNDEMTTWVVLGMRVVMFLGEELI